MAFFSSIIIAPILSIFKRLERNLQYFLPFQHPVRLRYVRATPRKPCVVSADVDCLFAHNLIHEKFSKLVLDNFFCKVYNE